MTAVMTLNTLAQRLEDAYLLLRDQPGQTATQLGDALGVEDHQVRTALGKKINQFALLASERTPKDLLFSDAALEALLRQAAAKVADGEPLTSARYKEIRAAQETPQMPAVATVLLRYGSWRAALEAANLPHTDSTRVYDRRWSEDDMTLAVADAILATGSSSFRGYERWAKGRDDVPSQVRITSDRSWVELARDAYQEFAEGGRRRTKYQAVLSRLVNDRRKELNTQR